MAYSSSAFYVGPLGYSASSHGGREWYSVFSGSNACVCHAMVPLSSVLLPNFHHSLFYSVRVRCSLWIWLYDMPVTPFLLFYRGLSLRERLSLTWLFVKLLRCRVCSFVFMPCLLVKIFASLLLTLSWSFPRLAFATAVSVVCTRAPVVSVT